MTFEEHHIKAQDAYLRQACDATAEATVARMFEAIGYRPGMVIVPASRIEKLEAALRNVLLWADRCQQCDYDDDWAIIERRARAALEGKDD